MNYAAFRPLFDRVCADFGLSEEAREQAWRSCIKVSRGSDPTEFLDHETVAIYRALDATKPPFRAQR